MPFKNGNMQPNETRWTPAMISFLKENFFSLTNQQLADALRLTLTVTRNKSSELGLKRIIMEYWTDDQVSYLVANYQTMGDVEIAEHFENVWPKKKRWIKQHICKKRKYLKLQRTENEVAKIRTKNSSLGGNAYTIDKNSSSLNMHPVWIAQRIAWRNKPLQKELLNYPEIIEAKKNLIILSRLIKQNKNGKTKN
jgi:hypothetical protein